MNRVYREQSVPMDIFANKLKTRAKQLGISNAEAETDDELSAAAIGEGFKVSERPDEEIRQYLLRNHISAELIDEFCSSNTVHSHHVSLAIQLSDTIVAVGILLVPKQMEPTARLLVHTLPENPNCELFTDHILDKLIRHACATLPTAISLAYLSGQPVVRKYAKLRGFLKSASTKDLTKIALGRPITNDTWHNIADTLRRRTGFALSDQAPKTFSTPITIVNREGTAHSVQPIELESILSPSIIVCAERPAVLIPIRRNFSDELLGTSKQSNFSFIEEKDASFVALRSYVNSPRTASAMRPHLPILFYESLKQNGRGAIVAMARIVDVSVVRKTDIPSHRLRRLVVNDVDDFSASDEVLLTTFDNLLELPNPVSLSKIRQVGAAKASLVAPETIDSVQTAQIINWGWAGA